MKNSAYLKKYVENHPNNKMAWYLLGKEYEQSGQEGKAHYCYIQAGSVYEAFESSKIPEDLWMGYEADILHESRRQEQRSRWARKIGLALLLLLFLSFPSAQAPGLLATTTEEAAPEPSEIISPEDKPDKRGSEADELSAQPTEPRKDAPRFTAIGYTPGGRGVTGDIGGLLQGNETEGHYQVVLAMGKKGKWLNWSHRMPVVYGIQSLGNGQTNVQSYDPAACLCTPPDSGKLKAEAGEWITRQESLAVLSSAMVQYREKTGKWPSSMDELTKPFPNNWLAGTNAHMKEAFEPMLQELIKREQSDGKSERGESGNGKSALEQNLKPFFAQPLEVIVDTSNHRLAVVSGSVILRSYQVGLGGDKTPEGTFRISDKVVNPNGKSNGEFGSRGMQLSDTNYAIHGTNEPDSIGADESLGCVRMGKKDVEELFDLLPVGTKVTIGKGGLPDQDLTPTKRFTLGERQDQSNPHRTYRWLH